MECYCDKHKVFFTARPEFDIIDSTILFIFLETEQNASSRQTYPCEKCGRLCLSKGGRTKHQKSCNGPMMSQGNVDMEEEGTA